MELKQTLIPVALLAVPAALLGGWLMLSDEDPRPAAFAEVDEAAEDEVPSSDDADRATRPSKRASSKRPRPRQPEAGDDEVADGDEEAPGVEEGGADAFDDDMGSPPHPAHRDAVDALNEGDHEAALKSAQECLEDDPNHRGCWDDQLRALLMGGDLEQAQELIAACHEGRDDPALCHGADVTLALQSEDVEAAAAALAKMEEEDPNSRFTVMARAQVNEQSGKDKLAKVDFTIACLRGHTVACAKAPGTAKAGGP